MYGDGFASVDGELAMSAFGGRHLHNGDAVMPTAKRKVVAIPSLEEQVDALFERLDDQQLARVVELVQQRHDNWLDQRAAEGRPASVPQGVPRRMWEARAAGRLCDAVRAAIKEGCNFDGKTTKGKAALLTMWRERPHEFVKSVFSIMPKEFVFESIVTELADDELDRMIEMFREQQRLAREGSTLPALGAPKMIPPHAN
jgi:hypothetical protein